MNSEHDEVTVQRHRAAVALLDERPADSVRATVLAAAARVVDAKPADAARPWVRRDGAAQRWYRPLGAAALLVVSVLTGLVAMQAYRERPDLIVSTRVASRPSTASAEAPSTAEPARASPQPATPRPADQERAQSAASPAPAAVHNRGTALHTNKKVEAANAPPVTAPARAHRRDAAPIASPESRGAPMPDQGALASATIEQAHRRSSRDRASSLHADAANAASDVPAAAGAVLEDSGPAQRSAPAQKMSRGASAPPEFSPQEVEPASPELWVARIVRLREEHRDEDADRELARLRERFPAHVVPGRALRHHPIGDR